MSDRPVPLPIVGNTDLVIPPFFIVKIKPRKRWDSDLPDIKWRILNPLTIERTLATRKGKKSINIVRKNVLEPELKTEKEPAPLLSEFSDADQRRLRNYFDSVKKGEHKEYTTKNKPRGFPATLYKNARKAGLTLDPSTTTYRKNAKKGAISTGVRKGPPQKRGRKPITMEAVEDNFTRPPAAGRKRVIDAPRENVLAQIADEYYRNQPKEDEEITFPAMDITEPKEDEVVNKLKDLIPLWEKGIPPRKEDETYNFLMELQKTKDTETKEVKTLRRKLTELYKQQVKKQREQKGKGLIGYSVLHSDIDDSDMDAPDDDGSGNSGGFLGLEKALKPITKVVDKVKDKAQDITGKVLHGRMDYAPSVKKIIDKYADQEVKGIDLYRKVLSSVYTTILNVLTWGEFNKRLKEQPKDKLFHISMWVHLANGTTILVEKNEVISMKVNPAKISGAEHEPIPKVPAGLKFKEMLDKTQQKIGDKKFFLYSAKDCNCGNFIESILEANDMDTIATHNFIGQDAKTILEGYPNIRKFMNTLTDVAGRANVIKEGGKLSSSEAIDWEDMNWGSFTQQFEAYKRIHHNNEIKDLEDFAKMIIASPKDYRPKTLKRARFYINVILKKNKISGSNIMPHRKRSDSSSEEEEMEMEGGAVGIALHRPMFHIPQMRQHPAMVSGRAGYHTLPMKPHNPLQVMEGMGLGSGIHHHHHYHINQSHPHMGDEEMGGMGFGGMRKALPRSETHGVAGPRHMVEESGMGLGSGLGSGMRKGRFAKGSKEAKEFMASLRKKKGSSGGAIPAPPSRSFITDPSLMG